LWADQEPGLLWRWIPTNEALFLAGRHGDARPSASNEADKALWKSQPGDCVEYRGANRDGVLPGVSISTDWDAHPPKMLWRKKVGPGWSGIILVDGHLVTQEQRDTAEAVVCYDAATGEEVWAHEDPVRFEEDLAGPGPRGTPTFADGHIYSFGALGQLNCLKAETGEVVWSHDCVADVEVTKSDLPQWGYSVSPLVVDGLVIVFAGGSNGKSVLAYKTSDGELAWKQAGGKQSYSSPQLMTLHGKKQVLMHDTSALRALNIADGAQLWEFPSTGALSLPMLQPHAAGSDSVAFSTEPGVAVLDIKQDGDKWSADARWTSNKLRAGFSYFVLNKGCLFGFDDGKLCCFDLTDGKRLWLKGRLGHDQILSLPDQDVLLISTEEGDVVLVSADRQGYKELGRFKAIEGKTWNSPVLVGGHLFLRNAAEMAAFDVSPPHSAPTN
jgi:outer membrane protein assembly factor BamB